MSAYRQDASSIIYMLKGGENAEKSEVSDKLRIYRQRGI